MGEFNGEVEILAPNFKPPNYPMAAVRGGLNAEAWALPNFISPATCAFKFGRKKIFSENNFFGKKCRAKTRGNFKENGASQLHRSNCVRSGRYRHCAVKVCNEIPR